jgi:hypothetical protein
MGLDTYHFKFVEMTDEAKQIAETMYTMDQLESWQIAEHLQAEGLMDEGLQFWDGQFCKEVGYLRKQLHWGIVSFDDNITDIEDVMLMHDKACVDEAARRSFKENFVDNWEQGKSFIYFSY